MCVWRIPAISWRNTLYTWIYINYNYTWFFSSLHTSSYVNDYIFWLSHSSIAFTTSTKIRFSLSGMCTCLHIPALKKYLNMFKLYCCFSFVHSSKNRSVFFVIFHMQEHFRVNFLKWNPHKQNVTLEVLIQLHKFSKFYLNLNLIANKTTTGFCANSLNIYGSSSFEEMFEQLIDSILHNLQLFYHTNWQWAGQYAFSLWNWNESHTHMPLPLDLFFSACLHRFVINVVEHIGVTCATETTIKKLNFNEINIRTLVRTQALFNCVRSHEIIDNVCVGVCVNSNSFSATDL